MIKWNFSRKNDQSRELSDSITDSKFNINPFGSFTREIIQNSLFYCQIKIYYQIFLL